MLTAPLLDGREARADLHALDCVDAHHRVRDVGIQLVEHRLAEPGRYASCDHVHARTDRVARATQLDHVCVELFEPRRVGAEEWIVVDAGQRLDLQDQRAELREIALDRDTEPLAKILASDCTRGDTHDRLARRRATAAAVVAEAVLLLVRVVGVPRAETVLDLVVVARALILVLDEQADRRAGRAPLEHARQDANLVGLLALTGMARGAGAPPFQLRLDVLLRQLQPRRTAVDDAAERRAVAFAEARDSEQLAEGVTGH